MKDDEFSFFNQQLAAMLRDGIPLEGALQRLCREMRHGALRNELEALGSDLGKGAPIADALKSRQLPELYKRMLLVGVKSGDLAGALTMVADYFHRQNKILTRLRGMMTYPLIVMMVAFLVSSLMAFIFSHVIGPAFKDVFAGIGLRLPTTTVIALRALQASWVFPTAMGIIILLMFLIFFVPSIHAKVVLRLPAFREARLSRIAASLELLLKNGVTLPDAIRLTEQLEANSAAASDLRQWESRLAGGATKFSDLAAGNKMIPPMFTWIVSGTGENLAEGFRQAADIYQSRAIVRSDVALYAVMPIIAVFLGAVIISQAFLLVSMYLPLLTMISNLS